MLFAPESGGLRSPPQPRRGTAWWIYDVMYEERAGFGCGFALEHASAPLAPGGAGATMPFKLTLAAMRVHVVIGRPMQLFRGIGTVEFLAWA